MNNTLRNSLVGLCLVAVTAGSALASELKDVPMAALESEFWQCDYASTRTLIGPSEAGLCSTIFEELKLRKFSGQFAEFMTWWTANKTREHKLISSKQ